MARTASTPPSLPLVTAEQAASSRERLSEGLVPAMPWIVMAWFAGVLALAVRQLGGWIMLRRLCGSGTEPVDEILAGKLTTIAKRLDVGRAVRLLSSVNVAVPSVIGHFKPVILFPASRILAIDGQSARLTAFKSAGNAEILTVQTAKGNRSYTLQMVYPQSRHDEYLQLALAVSKSLRLHEENASGGQTAPPCPLAN